jgi:hypothetical protein
MFRLQEECDSYFTAYLAEQQMRMLSQEIAFLSVKGE